MNDFIIDKSMDTVWINSASCCIARFGKMGIDIHRPVEDQSSKGECLFCTHELTTINDWEIFKGKVKEYFGISLTNQDMPGRLRNSIH